MRNSSLRVSRLRLSPPVAGSVARSATYDANPAGELIVVQLIPTFYN